VTGTCTGGVAAVGVRPKSRMTDTGGFFGFGGGPVDGDVSDATGIGWPPLKSNGCAAVAGSVEDCLKYESSIHKAFGAMEVSDESIKGSGSTCFSA
jgi:hypothetical protein